MEWKAEIDRSKWDELARKYPRLLATHMRKALYGAVLHFRDVHRRLRLSGGDGLHRRTGALVRSFKVGVSAPIVGLDGLAAWLASGSPYAGIHETGGTIRPKRRKFLAIPLPAAKTKAGVLSGRFVGTIAGQTAPSLYGVKGLFVLKSKAGGLLLAMKKGDGVEPLFILKRSVTLKPRLKFYETFRAWVRKPRFARFFRDAVEAAWRKAKSK